MTSLVSLDVNEVQIRQAGKQFEGLTGGTTKADKGLAAAISELVGMRTTIEDARKRLKAPIIAEGKRIDKEAKRLTAIVVEYEQPLKAEKQRVDKIKADAKAERERLKREAEQAIERKVQRIRELPGQAALATPEDIREKLKRLEDLDLSEFGDRANEVEGLSKLVAGQLTMLLEQSLQAERDRAELKRLKEEAAANQPEPPVEQDEKPAPSVDIADTVTTTPTGGASLKLTSNPAPIGNKATPAQLAREELAIFDFSRLSDRDAVNVWQHIQECIASHRSIG